MANAIFKALLTFIANVIGVFLAPIDLIVVNAFPRLNQIVSGWTSSFQALSSYMAHSIGYVINLLPTTTARAVWLYLGVVLATYTITISIHLIVKLLIIIKNIKFW